MLLSASHLALSHANNCYANAMNLAEAGVNWELWKISRNTASADQSPVTVEYPSGSGRTFTVRIEPESGGGPWAPPAQLWVISTGIVDGARRTVRVRAGGENISGEYALFGLDSLTIGGNAGVVGAMGTNGVTTVNGEPNLDGNFWYCGSAAGGEDVTSLVNETGHQAYHAAVPEYFPTVNELADQRALDHYGTTTAQGVDFFRTHNDNAQITDLNGNPVTLSAYQLTHASFNGLPAGADGRPVINLPPGDYYLEYLDITAQDALTIDSLAGLVNIWLGPAGGYAGNARDTINGAGLVFTGHDVTQFHLYEGSRRELRMNGTMDFYGMVYAYNGPDASGNYYGSAVLNGTGHITGSVIAWDVVKTTGDFTIIFPSEGGAEVPGDPTLFYAYQDWEEVNPL